MPDQSTDPARLVCQLISGGRTPEQIRAGQWPAISEAAVAHGLGPLLWQVLAAHPAPLPGGVEGSALRAAATQAAARAVLLTHARQQIDRALAAAGLARVWVKGAALTVTVYEDATLRPMSDLDVLVQADQRERALAAVQALGYRAPHLAGQIFASDDPIQRAASPHDFLVGGPGGAVAVEIHHRLLHAKDAPLTDAQHAWFWGHVRSAGDSALPVLAPAAHLLYLCAHAVLRHGERDLYLLRWVDMHRLIERTPPDWETVVAGAVYLRWTTATAHALRRCADWFGTPLPEGLLQTLAARRPPDEDPQRVTYMQTIDAGWQQRLRAARALPLRQQVRLVWRVMVPPRDYMRARYHVPSGRPAWLYYPYRWLMMVGKALRALVNRRRPPSA